MLKVKICGITTLEAALAAVEAGAWAVGFVFAESRRRISPEHAKQIMQNVPSKVCKVGVFANASREFVAAVADFCQLDLLQFHGDESPEYCAGWQQPVIKAFRVRDAAFLDVLPRYRVFAYLLDTYHPGKLGGTGKTFNWELARDAGKFGPVILAGGINAENVLDAFQMVRPYAVDVSSVNGGY